MTSTGSPKITQIFRRVSCTSDDGPKCECGSYERPSTSYPSPDTPVSFTDLFSKFGGASTTTPDSCLPYPPSPPPVESCPPPRRMPQTQTACSKGPDCKYNFLKLLEPRRTKMRDTCCCPYGSLQFPICSWFASPKYFHLCPARQCCKTTCLFSNERKLCECSNKLPTNEVGAKISSNTLHTIRSVNDIRAWSACCEDKRRYFLEQMLQSPPEEKIEREDDMPEEASPMQIRYEKLISQKDAEIERLKQLVRELEGRKSGGSLESSSTKQRSDGISSPKKSDDMEAVSSAPKKSGEETPPPKKSGEETPPPRRSDEVETGEQKVVAIDGGPMSGSPPSKKSSEGETTSSARGSSEPPPESKKSEARQDSEPVTSEEKSGDIPPPPPGTEEASGGTEEESGGAEEESIGPDGEPSKKESEAKTGPSSKPSAKTVSETGETSPEDESTEEVGEEGEQEAVGPDAEKQESKAGEVGVDEQQEDATGPESEVVDKDVMEEEQQRLQEREDSGIGLESEILDEEVEEMFEDEPQEDKVVAEEQEVGPDSEATEKSKTDMVTEEEAAGPESAVTSEASKKTLAPGANGGEEGEEGMGPQSESGRFDDARKSATVVEEDLQEVVVEDIGPDEEQDGVLPTEPLGEGEAVVVTGAQDQVVVAEKPRPSSERAASSMPPPTDWGRSERRVKKPFVCTECKPTPPCPYVAPPPAEEVCFGGIDEFGIEDPYDTVVRVENNRIVKVQGGLIVDEMDPEGLVAELEWLRESMTAHGRRVIELEDALYGGDGDPGMDDMYTTRQLQAQLGLLRDRIVSLESQLVEKTESLFLLNGTLEATGPQLNLYRDEAERNRALLAEAEATIHDLTLRLNELEGHQRACHSCYGGGNKGGGYDQYDMIYFSDGANSHNVCGF